MAITDLERLNTELDELVALVASEQGSEIEYDVDGVCLGRGLYKLPGLIAVQDAVLSEGTVFPTHAHPQWECLIVYEGSITVAYDDGSSTVANRAEVVIIPPHTNHAVTCTKAARLIGVIVPDSEGYPDG